MRRVFAAGNGLKTVLRFLFLEESFSISFMIYSGSALLKISWLAKVEKLTLY
jgi:hypothetical protein